MKQVDRRERTFSRGKAPHGDEKWHGGEASRDDLRRKTAVQLASLASPGRVEKGLAVVVVALSQCCKGAGRGKDRSVIQSTGWGVRRAPSQVEREAQSIFDRGELCRSDIPQ